MFLKKTLILNKPLVEAAMMLHQSGTIQPDTYVIDYDQTVDNARMILEEATKQNVELYFMMKQLGRNPYLAQAFMDLGYKGAVVVDFREAEVMMNANIPLGNVGHLVQTPKHMLKKIISYGTEVMTVFTIEKLREINQASRDLATIQDVILKVYSEGDMQYPSQEGGVDLRKLSDFLIEANKLSNIKIVGATAFPAFLYNETTGKISKTHNYETIMKAIETMRSHGCEIKQINAPSTTSVRTLKLMEGTPITHGEPGHGLTGTTPAHAYEDMEEIPSVVYVSEVSHNFESFSYCYGGGYYRRSHVSHALSMFDSSQAIVDVIPMQDDNIDYYFKLKSNIPVSSTVIMAFRFQIFVTRSRVAIVKGIQSGKPCVVGIYDSFGKKESL